MPTTVGRSRGRQGVHSGAQGAAGDHMRKIMATLITAVVVLVAVLVLTKAGRDIDAATQRFMLYYAGVLALVGLTGSVLLGLVATDRIVMTPGHRVMAQAVHRAFSFGTLAFLIIHIVTEILAQRSHVIDAVVPFLSPYRTFYIGLGTIASDLIVLLVVTSIRAQAVHRTRKSLALAGHPLRVLRRVRVRGPARAARRPDGQAVRRLELRVRHRGHRPRPRGQVPGHLAAAEGEPAVVPQRRPGQARRLVAAARRGLGLAQARLGSTIGGTVQVLPAGLGGQGAADSWTALPVPGRSPASGPLPALGPAPAYAGPSADAYQRPRLHTAGRAAVRRRWAGRDAGSSLRVRGPVALGAGRPRPAAALRARVRRTAAVRGRAAGTRRHTPGRTVLLPVRTARPQAPARAVPRGLPGPSRIRPLGHPAQYAGAGASPGRAARPAPPRRPEFRPDASAQNRSDASARHGADAPPGHRPAAAGRSGAAAAQRDGSGYRSYAACGHGSHAAPGHRSYASARHGADARWTPARCPVRIPARCRGPARGSRRATGWVRVPVLCRVRARVPCRAWAPVLCRAPTRAPCRAWAPARRRPGSTAVRMPVRRHGPTPAGCRRVRPPARCRGQAPARCPAPDQPLPAGDPVAGPRSGPPRAARRGSHRAQPTDPRYRDMPGPTGGDEWQ